MTVKYLPFQPHCFSFGGFDLQMINTLDAVNLVGDVKAEKMDVWSKDGNFDVLHLWGLDIDHFTTIQLAKMAKKKVVVTALLPYFDDVLRTAWFHVSSIIDRAKFWKKMINNIDVLVVLSASQADIAVKYFNIARNKVWVIPAIIADEYFDKQADNSFTEFYNIPMGYSLITGNICQRKNQLNVIKACIELQKPLVLIGNVLDGNENYGLHIDNLISKHNYIHRIAEIEANSILLRSAYKNCSLFILPSLKENQPASALEAAISGKPLVLANLKYAHEPYFKLAHLCNPHSVISIQNAILEALKYSGSIIHDEAILNSFHSTIVARKYTEMYKTLS